MSVRTLTPKQEAFCQHYVRLGNGKQAAIAAGYSNGKSAEVTAFRMLRNAKVKERIAGLQTDKTQRVRLQPDDIIGYLQDALLFDQTEWLEFTETTVKMRIVNGKPAIPPRYRRLITKIYQTQFGVRIEFVSKDKALENIMRMLGMMKDSLDVKFGAAELLGMVRQRKAQNEQNNQ